ncbi:flagellar protein FlgN [Croceicoccus gelatinilyticus]|uniref:flagellar protein FlgN n=1 Tax=Croceicoccus gelatinilyticus TaxID=2835536 RepID=UPI001BD0CA1F|nr:flagellar protein FlgN [Croceicoccus gelatinilyticus]MBS7671305.1 flagellar protein FlgN [Croceicoccus gelatinilyticus]
MSNNELRKELRQILAVLDAERQAIAALDLDAITIAANDKLALCRSIDGLGPIELDDECKALLMTARDCNETNKQMRNLVAANISNRIDMLTGSPRLYGAKRYADMSS